MPDSMPSPAKPGLKPVRPRRAQRPLPGRSPAGGTARVVAIGASAGGLEACTKLLDALPVPTGMAFILVQHLAPNQKSLLVDLLAEHTALAVVQAADGMPVEPEHLYVIPPGSYLSVGAGVLRLSPPEMRNGVPHGARLPFDALLHSMAEEYGPARRLRRPVGDRERRQRGAACRESVGRPGDRAGPGGGRLRRDAAQRHRHRAGGCHSATAGIPAVLARRAQAGDGHAEGLPSDAASPSDDVSGTAQPDPVTGIIELLRARTRHDFTPYKRGTLERRIERRMGLALPGKGDAARYLDLLRGDAGELDLLAKDLLIHVTSFFRDPAVFAALAEHVIPGLLRDRAPGDPVRVWIPGCSTGEEAYSLVILFREALEAAQQAGRDGGENRDPRLRDGLGDVKLQVFASDIDADAVAVAREGLYPPAITSDVSVARLQRFFTKEDGHGYRVHPDIRASVVFTVQDLLADPPFSRLDLVSCRNLMIYLGRRRRPRRSACSTLRSRRAAPCCWAARRR